MRIVPHTIAPAVLLLLSSYATVPVLGDTVASSPGVQPIISKANVLLSSGHFGDAAKAYSEAIEKSPADYLLYYKRATAYLSLQRHSSALEDFDKVLSLTSGTFDNAHLQKARIYLKDGSFDLAHSSLASYLKSHKKSSAKDSEVAELEKEIEEAGRAAGKMESERRAQLWTACVETGSQALRHASHSLELRTWRAECALASGDVASAVGDLTRLSNLVPSSTTLFTHIFRLSYFLLPPGPSSMNNLKQCLHYDPDSKPCLTLHRLAKSLDKSFKALDDALTKEDWKAVVKVIVGPASGKTGELWKKWEEAMKENMQAENLFPLVPPALVHPHHDSTSSSTSSDSSSSTSPSSSHHTKSKSKKPLPQVPFTLTDAEKSSPQREHIIRSACKAYTHLADTAPSSASYRAQRANWCSLLLSLPGHSEDIDGLVGRAETLLSEGAASTSETGPAGMYAEAVRLLEKAFEASGRSDRSIHGRLTKAQKKLKQSKQKDYYKILGNVPRDADARTIKKAFRKAAKLAHPDKGGSEEKMAALNEAYEVLSNPELKERYDNGEDPMDPANAQGGGGNPFAGGFPGGDPFAQFFGGGGGRGRPNAGPGGFQYQSGGGGGGWHFSHGF